MSKPNSFNKLAKDIVVGKMKDGEVGVIIEWGENKEYVGRVVQRHKNILLSLGRCSGCGWGDISNFKWTLEPNYRVRIINPVSIVDQNGEVFKL
jgi:hypothetical protein